MTAAFLLFVGSLLASAAVYFAARPFSVREAVISYLQCREFNPDGFAWAAAGTLLCGVALWPVTVLFQQRLHVVCASGSTAGVSLYRIGLVNLMLVGLQSLAGVHPWNPGHIASAFAGFIGLSGGLLICLVVAVR